METCLHPAARVVFHSCQATEGIGAHPILPQLRFRQVLPRPPTVKVNGLAFPAQG